MSNTQNEPTQAQCAQQTHWIEILIRDEHGKAFSGIKGILKDACGVDHPIVAGESAILLEKLAAGNVTLKFDNPTWLSETEKKRPFTPKDDNPVDAFITKNPKGHKSTARVKHSATLGDFVELNDEQIIPKRHKAKALGALNLETDKSHVVVIQACNYITLRLGLFFDGTNNNSYSAKWGKEQLEAKYSAWSTLYANEKNRLENEAKSVIEGIPLHKLSEACFDTGFEGESCRNELTNVQKLFDIYRRNGLYQVDKKSDAFEAASQKNLYDEKKVLTYSFRSYVTGIGTENSEEKKSADESQWGYALGIGEYGVIGKAQRGISQVIDKLSDVHKEVTLIDKTVDGFNKLEFDVFGFSRGSAAARHFINLVLDGVEGEFSEKFKAYSVKKIGNLRLPISFDWQSNKHCVVKFAGLFDTVAAVGRLYLGDTPDNGWNAGVRLWIDPNRVERAVHLVANHNIEYRANFSANLLNKGAGFTELVVHGAHSDIGGGYHSRSEFKEKDYWLPLAENLLIAESKVTMDFDYAWRRRSDRAKKRINDKLEKLLEKEKDAGWTKEDYVITDIKEKISKRGKKKMITYSASLMLKRIVEGELPRLYLRAMFGLAEHEKVPFQPVDVDKKDVWTSTAIPHSLYYPIPDENLWFKGLCEQTLMVAQKGDVDGLRRLLVTDSNLRKFREQKMIHHSSDGKATYGFIHAYAHNETKDGVYQREAYACEKPE